MSIPLIFIPAALILGVIENLPKFPKSDRKIRRQWRKNNKRWVW